MYSNWMKEKQQVLGHKRITEIILPGTHDSGCYPKAYTTGLRTQSMNIPDQLSFGIRYLDLRVIWYTAIDYKKRFRLHHGGHTAPGLELKPILIRIRDFIEAHPKEILLLDCHQTWHGYPASHRDMDSDERASLAMEFRDALLNHLQTDLTLTYDQMVKQDRTVLVFMDIGGLEPKQKDGICDAALIERPANPDFYGWGKTMEWKWHRHCSWLLEKLRIRSDFRKVFVSDAALSSATITSYAEKTNKKVLEGVLRAPDPEIKNKLNVLIFDFVKRPRELIDMVISLNGA